ncbi:MAG: hypothetical protein JRF33_12990 [Deltaproteobacteria bacterium]|nr:hypothetical protein [Deltaproteobacteria bacterium]
MSPTFQSDLQIEGDTESLLLHGDDGAPIGPDSPGLMHIREFEGKVKGALLVGVLDHYEDIQPGFRKRLREHLVPAYNTMLDEALLPSAWLPEQLFVAVLRASLRLLPFSSLEDETQQARIVFERTSRRYHSVFFRFMGPRRIIKGAGRLWGLYHTIGELKVDTHGKGFAEGRLIGNPALLCPRYPEGLIGALWGALCLAGAREIRVRYERQPPDVILLRFDWA